MGQSYSDSDTDEDEDEQDADPGTNTTSDPDDDRDSSSTQSQSDPSTTPDNPAGGATLSPSQVYDFFQSLKPSSSRQFQSADPSSYPILAFKQSLFGQTPLADPPYSPIRAIRHAISGRTPWQDPSSFLQSQDPSLAGQDDGTSAWTGALALRRGQFADSPDSDPDSTIPGLAPADQQPQDIDALLEQDARDDQARRQHIQQVNQSDPYISSADGRWKKQMAHPFTGAVSELDVLDNGTGTTDRGTGNVYVQTSQGPQLIAVDPQQKRLAQIVDQKAQAQALGSPIDANIDSATSALAATQRQLQAFQGVPERMAAQIGKYTQASLDPNNTAAAAQLQQAQSAFSDWKQRNPTYTALAARRDSLANQIQSQTSAKAQNNLQVAQLLTTPQYVQWNGNAPSSPNATGPNASASTGSAPASDLSIHDIDSRAGIIAAQNGIPPALGYASALAEAKQQGAQSLDGAPLDTAIQGLQPAVQSQLLTMTQPQLRQAFQSGLITRQQPQTALTAQRSAQNQPASTTSSADDDPQDPDPTSQSASTAQPDPVAQSVSDLTAKAAALRTKIQSAFDTGGADGVTALATYRTALADTEDQLHTATQTLLSRVPATLQQRIARAVAPGLDWDDAAERNAQDPMAHFATENLGSALLGQDFLPDQQFALRKLASIHGVNPDLASHIANQAAGANGIRDLYATVLQGRALDPQRAQTLQDMGFLQQSDPDDPTSPLHLTEDAQRLLPPGVQNFIQVRPDAARYNPSPDPAHGSALYQNAVAGMQHFADAAERTLPAQSPAPDAPTAPIGGAAAPPTSASPPPQQAPSATAGDSQQSAGILANPSGRDEPPGGGAQTADTATAASGNTDPTAAIAGPKGQEAIPGPANIAPRQQAANPPISPDDQQRLAAALPAPARQALAPPKVDATTGTVRPEGFWQTVGRSFGSKIIPAAATAVGGAVAGALAIETGPGALVADAAGGALAGALADKAQRTIMGDQWANQNDAQMQANAQAHPVAAQIGAFVPFLISLLGGGGGSLVRAGDKVVGKAITSAGKQAVLDAAAIGAKAQAPLIERVAQNAALGLRTGLSNSTQQKYVEGKDVSVLDQTAKSVLQFGATGLFAPAKTLLGAVLGRPVTDSAAITLAGSLYDTAIHGQPFDLKKTAQQIGGDIPAFVLQNALLGFFAHGMSAKMEGAPADTGSGTPPTARPPASPSGAEPPSSAGTPIPGIDPGGSFSDAGSPHSRQPAPLADPTPEAQKPPTPDQQRDIATQRLQQISELPNPDAAADEKSTLESLVGRSDATNGAKEPDLGQNPSPIARGSAETPPGMQPQTQAKPTQDDYQEPRPTDPAKEPSPTEQPRNSERGPSPSGTTNIGDVWDAAQKPPGGRERAADSPSASFPRSANSPEPIRHGAFDKSRSLENPVAEVQQQSAAARPGASQVAAPPSLAATKRRQGPASTANKRNLRPSEETELSRNNQILGVKTPGVTVTPNGGVDFSNSHDLYPTSAGQANIVVIRYTGSRRQDYRAANIAGNLGARQKPPTGYAWHHVDDYDPLTNTGTMQLIKRSTHERNYPHDGGVKQYETAKGTKYK